jgi:hypothetical protein
MLAVILALEALALNPSKAFAPAKTHASKPQLSFAAPAAQQRRVVPPYMQEAGKPCHQPPPREAASECM